MNVVCVKSKPRYSHEWVNRLYGMVEKNMTIPHKFICLTDDDSGLKCASKRLPQGLRGWWAKLALFRTVLTPPVLYLDLDTLILGNLDFVKDYDGDFALLRDFYREDGFGSGVMLWTRPFDYIWNEWLRHGTPDHPLGDQGWMEMMVPDADCLQDVFPGKFISYKVHCQEKVPEDARVLSFHGEPKNIDFPDTHWVSKVWKGERLAA